MPCTLQNQLSKIAFKFQKLYIDAVIIKCSRIDKATCIFNYKLKNILGIRFLSKLHMN